MAFMMPVMKNNYEIYPGKAVARRPRSRKSSSSSSTNPATSSNNAVAGRPAPGTIQRPSSRSVSESASGGNPSPCRFQYSSSAPSSGTLAAAAAARPQRTVRFCRSVSSDGDHQPASGSRRSMSGPPPTVRVRTGSMRSTSSTSSSSNSTSSGINNDEDSSTGGSTGNVPDQVKSGGLGKFHSKLIDKLKRKFRMKDDVDVCTSEDDSAVHIRSST